MQVPDWAICALALALSAQPALADDRLADPLARRDAAYQLLQSGDWSAAAEAYHALAASNPADGGYWYFLGRAQAGAGDCASALPSLQRAIELGGLGGSLQRANLEMAACLAVLGRGDDAMVHLTRAHIRYDFSDFESLSEDARFASLLDRPDYVRMANPAAALSGDRNEGWRADLAYLVWMMEARHPDPFHEVSRSDWHEAIDALDRNIPQMSDLEVIGALQGLIAMIGDGHTSLYPPMGGERSFNLLPIVPYVIGDDVYIISARPDHAGLVGARILTVAGMPVGEAYARIAAAYPRDNRQTFKLTVPLGLSFAETGASLLGSEDVSGLTFELELASGEHRRVRLEGQPLDRNPLPSWAPEGWPHMGAEPLPLWLSRTGEAQWFTDLDGTGTVYAQINQIRDSDAGSFADFTAALGQHVRETGARHLIIDLRHNLGGDGSLNAGLMREIMRMPGIDHETGLFVITGRRTFSAAMNLTALIENMSEAIFVGEPTGSRPNFYGEDTSVDLPYSHLHGSISSRWFQGGATSDDLRPWIAPDLPAELTPADVLAGRDPALEAIGQFLQAR